MAICDDCQARHCVPACPSRLRPDDPRKGTACVTCFECAKACPENNVGFGLAGARVQDQAFSRGAVVFVFLAGGFVAHDLFAEALWFLGILPALLWGLVRNARVALYLIPVVATGHAIKAVVKFNGWVTYLPGAWHGPVGLATARNLTAPSPLLPARWIGVLAVALLVGCLAWAGWWITRRLSGTMRQAAYAGAGALGALYAVVVPQLTGS